MACPVKRNDIGNWKKYFFSLIHFVFKALKLDSIHLKMTAVSWLGYSIILDNKWKVIIKYYGRYGFPADRIFD